MPTQKPVAEFADVEVDEDEYEDSDCFFTGAKFNNQKMVTQKVVDDFADVEEDEDEGEDDDDEDEDADEELNCSFAGPLFKKKKVGAEDEDEDEDFSFAGGKFKKKKTVGAATAVAGGGSGKKWSGDAPPCCQVENCGADLTDAKLYYRRYRVCGPHIKAPVVVVEGFRQRFCQQCSRFQEESEFDGFKRSCRVRLAGHNERRRRPSQTQATAD